MKSFIISLLLLLLITAGLTANIIYQKTVFKELNAMLEALPHTPEAAVRDCESILIYWKEKAGFFSLTMQEHETERLTTAFTELASYAASGDETEFLRALKIAEEAVRLIGEAEKVSLAGIF